MNILSKPKNATFIDLTGLTFGSWSVESYAGRAEDVGMKGGGSFWNCKCLHCGIKKVVRGYQLTHGRSTWCGNKSGQTTHPLYNTYCLMIRRCESTSCKVFDRYGGRGIKVCQKWRQSFWAFVDDIGPRPDGMSLDRIDNDGDYSPENCRWANAKEQGQNKRNNLFVDVSGEVVCISEAARRIGLKQTTISWRLSNGWCKVCAINPDKFVSCDHAGPLRAEVV